MVENKQERRKLQLRKNGKLWEVREGGRVLRTLRSKNGAERWVRAFIGDWGGELIEVGEHGLETRKTVIAAKKPPRSKRHIIPRDMGIAVTLTGALGVALSATLHLGYYMEFGVSLDEAGISGYQFLLQAVMLFPVILWVAALALVVLGAIRITSRAPQYLLLLALSFLLLTLFAQLFSGIDPLSGSPRWFVSSAAQTLVIAAACALTSYLAHAISTELRSEPVAERRLQVLLVMEFLLVSSLLQGVAIAASLALPLAALGVGLALTLRFRWLRHESGRPIQIHSLHWLNIAALATVIALLSPLFVWLARLDPTYGKAERPTWLFIGLMGLLGLVLLIDGSLVVRTWLIEVRSLARPMLAYVGLILMVGLVVGAWQFGNLVAKETKNLPPVTDAWDQEGRLGFASWFFGLHPDWVCITSTASSHAPALTTSPTQLLPTSSNIWITWDKDAKTRRWSPDGLQVIQASEGKGCQ